jgi:hypothetical protein
MRGEGGGIYGVANEYLYSCTQGAQINFGDLSPYLTCVQCLSKIVLGIIVLPTSLPQKDSNAQLKSVLAMVYSPTAKCSIKNLVISAHCRF